MMLDRLMSAIGDPRGQCYCASEALYHALGGKRNGWVPQVLRLSTGTHWYLLHPASGAILDLTVAQYATTPDYTKGRGCGFLTRRPSKRAQSILRKAGL